MQNARSVEVAHRGRHLLSCGHVRTVVGLKQGAPARRCGSVTGWGGVVRVGSISIGVVVLVVLQRVACIVSVMRGAGLMVQCW